MRRFLLLVLAASAALVALAAMAVLGVFATLVLADVLSSHR